MVRLSMSDFDQNISPCGNDQQHRAEHGTGENITYDLYPSIVEKIGNSVATGVVRALFTDVDATLVLGAGHSAAEIDQGQRDMRQLVAELNRLGFIIIPVTGSHFGSGTKTTGSIIDRIERGILPRVGGQVEDRSYSVDAYVSDGGALAVKAVSEGTPTLDTHYATRVSPPDFQYDTVLKKALVEAARLGLAPLGAEEQALMAQYDKHVGPERIYLQPGTQEGYHRLANKVAFYFYANTLQDRDAIEVHFQRTMEQFGLSVVCCEEKDANSAARRHSEASRLLAQESLPLKYCLDIVPFTKGSAVNYFADYISNVSTEIALSRGVARPTLEIWACGDSGNDIPLMVPAMVSRVVVVGGASAELVRCAEALTEQGKKVFIERDPSRLGPASIAAALQS
jgi:hydroxymethylpyrimidine pyrophosphatase-like HAD family hydrolase